MFKLIIESRHRHDSNDLERLRPREHKVDIGGMIAGLGANFRFLSNLSHAEKVLAEDTYRRKQRAYDDLVRALQAPFVHEASTMPGRERMDRLTRLGEAIRTLRHVTELE